MVTRGRKQTRTATYTSARDRGEAKRRAEAFLEEMRRRPDVARDRQTVAQFLEAWLEFNRQRLAPQTRRTWESITRHHLIPNIGSLRLDRLSAQDVDVMLARLSASGLAPTTVGNVRRVLNRAMSQAELWGRVAQNPVRLTSAPRSPNVERRTLSPSQALAFLEHVRGDRLEALWNVAACLGLRSAEVRGLRWEDVDGEMLHVRRSLQYDELAKAWLLREPKTARSLRRVPLPGFVRDLLEVRREQQRFEEKAPGYWNELGLVFTSRTQPGRPLSTWGTTSRFQDLLAEAGLPKVTFHDLRHCATSLMLSRGLPPRMVQEILGHASPAMTMGVYAHADDEQRSAAALALEAWRLG